MKTSIITILSSVLLVFSSTAQKRPLVGSGTVVSRSYELSNFENISFEDFDGTIEVEVGKPCSIRIEIDDNLAPRLQVSVEKADQLLTIALKDNYNGRLYLENTNIKIKVALPSVTSISHRGNTEISIKGIKARYFRYENIGNGSAVLQGEVENLDIKKTGNGEVRCGDLISKVSKVKSYGNGNVIINSLISLSAVGAGNCSVIQTGAGTIDPLSGIIGNGKVRRN
jgi:hypothetical protein